MVDSILDGRPVSSPVHTPCLEPDVHDADSLCSSQKFRLANMDRAKAPRMSETAKLVKRALIRSLSSRECDTEDMTDAEPAEKKEEEMLFELPCRDLDRYAVAG